jgi:three-Cys-motif partner protein
MRSATKFNWSNGLPQLNTHSKAKLKILESYLISYFKTLSKVPTLDEISVTIVDGFAGGGLYTDSDTGEEIKGSPLVCLDSVKLADYEINNNRVKKVNLNVDFIFNDINKEHVDSLKKILLLKEYIPNSKIQLFQSEFVTKLDEIIAFIRKKNPRNGRSIFILDQCGYTDVPTTSIAKIFSLLPCAEVILTFGVDSILNFANSDGSTNKLLNKIGLKDIPYFANMRLEELKASDKKWRQLIQSKLHKDLISACRAKYFTPFFIRNKTGHGSYWLIHMSQHPTARNVMTEVHWQNHNYSIHYGGAGINMFNEPYMIGYDPDMDIDYTNQSSLGYEFDDHAKQVSIDRLIEQLPYIIYKKDSGITFEQLFSNICNTTPATTQICRESLNQLLQYKSINIISNKGTVRRSGNAISNTDIIIPAKQKIFIY